MAVSFISLFNVTLAFSSLPQSFQEAKRLAYEIFKDHPETLYCHCRYTANKEVDLTSCNLENLETKSNSHKLQFEHMMSAENMGKQFACWREPLCQDKKGKPYKGRRCCQKSDKTFRQAEAELYNLWPESGFINRLRSNYRFAEIPEGSTLQGCNFKVDKLRRKVEPEDKVKGIVARAHLLMADKYHLRLSKKQRKLFVEWNSRFMPSDWEREWAARIESIEGYSNPYIAQYPLKRELVKY